MLGKATPERLSLFSDGVFAVLITVLLLELHPPDEPTYEALLAHWPQWLSYAVSYLFIDRIGQSSLFAALCAGSEPAPDVVQLRAPFLNVSAAILNGLDGNQSVRSGAGFLLALVFFLVNATYVALIWELVEEEPDPKPTRPVRRFMVVRALITLLLFALASAISLRSPLLGLGICIACLTGYLKPEPIRVPDALSLQAGRSKTMLKLLDECLYAKRTKHWI